MIVNKINLNTNPNLFLAPKSQNNKNDFENNIKLNNSYPSEISGRYQVMFGNNKFQEYDKKFIDTVSNNLRLSENDTNKLKNSINNYLKMNNFSSLECLVGEDKEELQGEFAEYVGNEMNFSDDDFNIFSDELIERCYYDKQYEPHVDKYKKDMNTVDKILDKNISDFDTKEEIRALLRADAQSRNFECVFDVFKSENEPASFMELLTDYVELDDSTSLNLLLDFVKVSKSEYIVEDKKDARNDYYLGQTDYAICDEIITKYNLTTDDADEIMPEIEKRYLENKNIKQIAFEISDKYRLPSGSEKFIEDTINSIDKNLFPFMP